MTSLRLYIILSLIIFLVILGSRSYAQSPDIVETVVLDQDKGLTERSVNFVTRDGLGYFYLFSDNVIQRYDGQNFEDVNTDLLIQLRQYLINIVAVTESAGDIYIRFLDGQLVSIPAGGLELGNVRDGQVFPETNDLNNGQLEKDSLSIDRDGKTYTWKQGQVEIFSNGIKKVIEIPADGQPKFLRRDKKGNIVAAYSLRKFFVDNYFVLDNNEVLHDFTGLTDSYDTVKDIYTDDAFYKWMICGFNNVSVLTLKRDGVEYLRHNPKVPEGSFGAIITGITSGDSTVLLCIEDGELIEYDPRISELKTLEDDYGFISTGLGKMVYDKRNDYYLIKGHDGDITDLYLRDRVSGQTVHQIIENKFRDFIINDKEELIMVGGYDSGEGHILKYDPETKKQTYIKLAIPNVRCIYQNSHANEYYLGTTEGMYICDEAFNVKSSFSQDIKGSKYMYHQDIVFTSYYADHIVACSRGGGVYFINSIGDSIVRHFSLKNGLSSPVVISAVTDDENNLWVATYNGLNVIDSSLNIIKSIYQFDGLPSREFNSLCVTKLDGYLYFGTINGAVKIHPATVLNWENSHRISQLSLRTFKEGNIQDLPVDTMAVSITSPDSLYINYKVTDYYFRYQYNVPQLSVSCPLENLDIDQEKGIIKITELDNGKFPLEMGLQSIKEKRRLDIELKKDYSGWKNFFLWLISILIISALIVYFSTGYISQREKQKTDQNKKISELQLSALQGQMNPHFIFNALGAIQYFIQTNDVKKADGYLSDFALLMRGILDSSSKKYISLKEELKLLRLYVGLEKARFENKFDVDFLVHDDIDDETLIPPMIVQPYIENAVNHGLHHLKDRKGKLSIRFEYKDDLLLIAVEDNGIGRAAAQKLNNNPKHISRAMSITKERINTINKSSEIKVFIAVDDMMDINDQPSGTRVQIKVMD